jgi:hypothetical protein
MYISMNRHQVIKTMNGETPNEFDPITQPSTMELEWMEFWRCYQTGEDSTWVNRNPKLYPLKIPAHLFITPIATGTNS